MPNELTNPNNVVTEERLAQFYQQILPYLGGMPDVLANKFNRADLYSTDEKLIGRWIDGKPLYQKSFSGKTPSSDTIIYTGAESDNIVNISGFVDGAAINYYDTGNWYVRTRRGTANKVYMQAAGFTNKDYIITVQYTKTTDSAVEIGDDTDYSTTEKIVGTWIDGKPIWQKTVTGTAPNGWGDTAHNIANIDKVINVSCGIIHANSYIVVGGATDTGRFLCQVGRTNVALYVAPNSYVGDEFICTFQYTKTSS